MALFIYTVELVGPARMVVRLNVPALANVRIVVPCSPKTPAPFVSKYPYFLEELEIQLEQDPEPVFDICKVYVMSRVILLPLLFVKVPAL